MSSVRRRRDVELWWATPLVYTASQVEHRRSAPFIDHLTKLICDEFTVSIMSFESY